MPPRPRIPDAVPARLPIGSNARDMATGVTRASRVLPTTWMVNHVQNPGTPLAASVSASRTAPRTSAAVRTAMPTRWAPQRPMAGLTIMKPTAKTTAEAANRKANWSARPYTTSNTCWVLPRKIRKTPSTNRRVAA